MRRHHTCTPRPAGRGLLEILAAATLAVAPVPLAAQGASAPTPHDYTQADVDFMQGMIIHHAQAVVMSDWTPTHGASPALQLLTKRIALSQRDEIDLMQRWLHDRGLSAPDPLHMMQGDSGTVHDTSPLHMPGMDMGPHPMMMSGMLSPEEMRQLDAARGARFDSLYLVGMIKHHQGALDMVADLYAKPGAGQQPEISTFATDIDAGQRAEIMRMQGMLNTITSSHTP
jgi:uncharacterized protein (DUF305 family)